MLVTIISFVAVLFVLVIVHELGHFFTAKAFGVGIDEFGLGFPPRLFSIKRGKTRYSINAMPLGGFVKMAGEEDPKIPGSLASKSIGARVLVLSAGSLMNALLPILLFSIAFMVPHNVLVGQVMIEDVAPNSPAEMAGIRPGDMVLGINDKTVRNNRDLQRNIQFNLGEEVTILIEHADSTTESVMLIPRWRPPAGQGAVGIMIQTVNPVVVRQSYPFWQAIPMGVNKSIETLTLFKNAIIGMIVGITPVAVGGPVAIAQLTGEAAKAGFGTLLEFAAFLSINLAIINIFPLPALDGGRIVFVLMEWIRRGRRVSPKTEGKIHLVGFFLLMVAIAAVTYQDILRIIAGESLIP